MTGSGSCSIPKLNGFSRTTTAVDQITDQNPATIGGGHISFHSFALIYIHSGGSKGRRPRRAPPLRTKIFLISCSFWENLANVYVGAPQELAAPPESCIRPWYINSEILSWLPPIRQLQVPFGGTQLVNSNSTSAVQDLPHGKMEDSYLLLFSCIPIGHFGQ